MGTPILVKSNSNGVAIAGDAVFLKGILLIVHEVSPPFMYQPYQDYGNCIPLPITFQLNLSLGESMYQGLYTIVGGHVGNKKPTASMGELRRVSSIFCRFYRALTLLENRRCPYYLCQFKGFGIQWLFIRSGCQRTQPMFFSFQASVLPSSSLASTSAPGGTSLKLLHVYCILQL